MPGASEDLLQAVYGLRKAAEAEFQGNAYYKVANEIDGLLEQLGWGARIPAGKDGAYGFAPRLAEVRSMARANLFANEYYQIAHRFEILGSFLAPSQEPVPASKSDAAATPVNPPLYTFAASPPSRTTAGAGKWALLGLSGALFLVGAFTLDAWWPKVKNLLIAEAACSGAAHQGRSAPVLDKPRNH